MAYSGMSQPMQEKQMAAAQNTAVGGNAGNPPRVPEFINFKMPKDLALVSGSENEEELLFSKFKYIIRYL